MSIVQKYQQAISRFRVSSHRLGVELGRHQKPRLPEERRLCIFCNSRKLDDEVHFLIHCEFLTNARKTFFSTVYKNIVDFECLNDKDKFRSILISTNEAVIFALGKFIHDGFRSRDVFQSNIHWILNTDFNFIAITLNLCINKSFISLLLLENMTLVDVKVFLSCCFLPFTRFYTYMCLYELYDS